MTIETTLQLVLNIVVLQLIAINKYLLHQLVLAIHGQIPIFIDKIRQLQHLPYIHTLQCIRHHISNLMDIHPQVDPQHYLDGHTQHMETLVFHQLITHLCLEMVKARHHEEVVPLILNISCLLMKNQRL